MSPLGHTNQDQTPEAAQTPQEAGTGWPTAPVFQCGAPEIGAAKVKSSILPPTNVLIPFHTNFSITKSKITITVRTLPTRISHSRSQHCRFGDLTRTAPI